MKKTLVALAALAATGAFAQVAITGGVAMGYQMDHDGVAKADASGLGVDTSEVFFKASEDLGGGMKVAASLSLSDANRGAIGGGDTSLALTSSVGTLTLATAKGADYLSGGVAKVGGNGLDGKVFSQRTVNDSVAFAVPLGALTVSLTHVEPSFAENAAGSGLGLGAAGASNGADKQRTNRISVRYTSGALVADGGYAVYDQQGDGSAAAAAQNSKSDLRAAVSYDLGSVKLGAGVQSRVLVNGTRLDMLASVSVPLGALTIGADWGSRKTDGLFSKTTNLADNTQDGTRSGYGLSVDYALSKRTGLGLYYTNYKAALNATENSTRTAVLLSHSF